MYRLFYLLPLSLVLFFSPITLQSEATQFIGPTERFLLANPYHKIKAILLSYGISETHIALANKLAEQERLGFFGYHGSRREFLIFQDILRHGIEDILDIPIKPDFHFLRIPGHPDLNVDSTDAFFALHPGVIDDNIALISLRLLSMNLAIYSPYQVYGELSLHYFSLNLNVYPPQYERVLIPFFVMLGVDPVYIHQAFEIGNAWLSKKSGVLMQFFDDSSNYHILDKNAYLAFGKGQKYQPQQPLSQLLLNIYQRIFPQFRLLLNNKYTLNPYSTFSIHRYTLTDSKEFQSYQNALTQYFKSLPVDQCQKEIYKAQLLSLWGDD